MTEKRIRVNAKSTSKGIWSLDVAVEISGEKLMAHKRGLDGVYLKPTMEQCHTEFVKAITEIVIDPTERQRLEIELKQQKITELEEKNIQLKDQQKQLDEMKVEQEKMKKLIYIENQFPDIDSQR